MKILHISDIHFRQDYGEFETGYKGMISKMDNPLIHLKTCLEQVEPYDLLLISGDLTEDGTVEDYSFLKNWLKKETENVPMIVTLGNHDIKEHFYEGWLNEKPSQKPYNLVTAFEDFYLVSFDTSVYGVADGTLSDNQFNWLEEQLKSLNDKPIILMTHHHLLNNQSSTKALPESNRLIKMIKKYPVLALLNGHTHHVFTGDIFGIQYYTVSGMSFIGEDEGEGIVRFDQRHGFNLYEIENKKIIQQSSENFITGKTIARVNMLEDL